MGFQRSRRDSRTGWKEKEEVIRPSRRLKKPHASGVGEAEDFVRSPVASLVGRLQNVAGYQLVPLPRAPRQSTARAVKDVFIRTSFVRRHQIRTVRVGSRGNQIPGRTLHTLNTMSNSGHWGSCEPFQARESRLHGKVVRRNGHLTMILHDHYDANMKRVASGILPVISIDRKAPKSLQRQIYDFYRSAMVDGRLRPGQRIPSTRVLASEIRVSRFPVLNAYAATASRRLPGKPRRSRNSRLPIPLPEQLTSPAPSVRAFAPIRTGNRPVANRCSCFLGS